MLQGRPALRAGSVFSPGLKRRGPGAFLQVTKQRAGGADRQVVLANAESRQVRHAEVRPQAIAGIADSECPCGPRSERAIQRFANRFDAWRNISIGSLDVDQLRRIEPDDFIEQAVAGQVDQGETAGGKFRQRHHAIG